MVLSLHSCVLDKGPFGGIGISARAKLRRRLLKLWISVPYGSVCGALQSANCLIGCLSIVYIYIRLDIYKTISMPMGLEAVGNNFRLVKQLDV